MKTADAGMASFSPHNTHKAQRRLGRDGKLGVGLEKRALTNLHNS